MGYLNTRLSKTKKYLTKFVKKPLINVEIKVKKNKYFKLNLFLISLKNLVKNNALNGTQNVEIINEKITLKDVTKSIPKEVMIWANSKPWIDQKP